MSEQNTLIGDIRLGKTVTERGAVFYIMAITPPLSGSELMDLPRGSAEEIRIAHTPNASILKFPENLFYSPDLTYDANFAEFGQECAFYLGNRSCSYDVRLLPLPDAQG
jgi:hypothetical protein